MGEKIVLCPWRFVTYNFRKKSMYEGQWKWEKEQLILPGVVETEWHAWRVTGGKLGDYVGLGFWGSRQRQQQEERVMVWEWGGHPLEPWPWVDFSARPQYSEGLDQDEDDLFEAQSESVTWEQVSNSFYGFCCKWLQTLWWLKATPVQDLAAPSSLGQNLGVSRTVFLLGGSQKEDCFPYFFQILEAARLPSVHGPFCWSSRLAASCLWVSLLPVSRPSLRIVSTLVRVPVFWLRPPWKFRINHLSQDL